MARATETAIVVLAETPDYVVINKPAGIDCQNSRADRPSLVEWIEKRCGFSGLVHRLDFGTSGVMIMAKTEKMARQITADLQSGRIERSYRAVVMGHMETAEGFIDAPLEGKTAKTNYKTIETFANSTELHVTLETGRKHQIRQHMLFVNHPILGDHLYKKRGSDLLFERPALHSWRLKWGDRSFEAPLPSDFLALTQRLRKSQTDFNA